MRWIWKVKSVCGGMLDGIPALPYIHSCGILNCAFPLEVVNLNISKLGSCCPQLEGMGICLDLLGSAWIYLDLLGSSWIYLDLDLLGSTWTYLDLLGSTWVYLDLLGSSWVYLDLLGSTWIYLDLLGSTWICMGLPEKGFVHYWTLAFRPLLAYLRVRLMFNVFDNA